MKSRLLNGLEDGHKDLVEGQWKTSSRMRERMVELLERDIDAIHLSMRNEAQYNKASWPYEQAEKIGEVKALKKIIALLQ